MSDNTLCPTVADGNDIKEVLGFLQRIWILKLRNPVVGSVERAKTLELFRGNKTFEVLLVNNFVVFVDESNVEHPESCCFVEENNEGKGSVRVSHNDGWRVCFEKRK